MLFQAYWLSFNRQHNTLKTQWKPLTMMRKMKKIWHDFTLHSHFSFRLSSLLETTPFTSWALPPYPLLHARILCTLICTRGWRFFTGCRIYSSDISITRAFSGGLVTTCICVTLPLAFSKKQCRDSGFCILAWVGFVIASKISPRWEKPGRRHDLWRSAWLGFIVVRTSLCALLWMKHKFRGKKCWNDPCSQF